MIAFSISDPQFAVIAVVVVILAILFYRLLRKDPFDRVIKFGIFIERMRYPDAEDATDAPLRVESADEKVTERTQGWQWPSAKDP